MTLKLEIKYVAIDSIKPYENNPRKNEQAVDVVAKSIELYGMRQPIGVDKNAVIVTGHTRFAACQKLGLKEVPIVEYDDLSAERARAYRIDDNKAADYSFFDDVKLRAELSALQYDGFDISKMTFQTTELESILQDWQPYAMPVAPVNPDETPVATPASEKVTIVVEKGQADAVKEWLKVHFLVGHPNVSIR